ncbi:unnamed protein product [Trypanosoma congolense IL3000]|uniref:Putative ecotin n=1 Tax=Trypanosoma congolense (strain IL3000) TaxID=1068625 RepID=F9WF27_TRYCI|nr:putative ecotin [Trypanosoma congolense IL3000]CCD15895.1 unnamed protein product [Trypanosoma congolense IL3000]
MSRRVSRFRSSVRRCSLSSNVDVDYCKFEEPPSPREGQKRCLFVLDPLEHHVESNDRMLELLPGRVEAVDGVNSYFINGTVTEEVLPGLGYPCYMVDLKETYKSRYAVPPEAIPEKKFLSIRHRKLIPYNSRQPVVVYMPVDADIHYRVWSGGEVKVAMAAEE